MGVCKHGATLPDQMRPLGFEIQVESDCWFFLYEAKEMV
jgi:hypothetical protein